jgi:hypothetical protein
MKAQKEGGDSFPYYFYSTILINPLKANEPIQKKFNTNFDKFTLEDIFAHHVNRINELIDLV